MNACLFMDRYKKAKMNHKLSSSRNDPERNNPLHNFKVHVGIHYITWYYPFNSGQFSWLYSSRGSSSRIKRTHKADYDIISGRILDNLESCINPMNFNKSKKASRTSRTCPWYNVYEFLILGFDIFEWIWWFFTFLNPKDLRFFWIHVFC